MSDECTGRAAGKRKTLFQDQLPAPDTRAHTHTVEIFGPDLRQQPWVDAWRSRDASFTFLMNAAMSFSMLYFSRACVAHSTASCCMSSDMSAFLITAFLSDMVALARNTHTQWWIH